MAREQSYQAIIIKKQAFGEADEIVTFLTEELGKVRALAKSIKLAGSKLQQALQPIFLNQITLAGSGNLPKIIGVQTLETFPQIQEPEKIKVWFVVAELLNKALPDEQKNQPLFALVVGYLEFLNSGDWDEATLSTSLVKFKIKLLELIGLQIHVPAQDGPGILFSANRGGFYIGQAASDSVSVSPTTWKAFQSLQSQSFQELAEAQWDTSAVSDLVNKFIVYQLDREIKAEKFL